MSGIKPAEVIKYNGWKLFERVIICAKPWRDNEQWLQGYVVEPGNKKQLENAKNWADYTEYGPYDWEKHEYEWKKDYPAQVYEFDNSGFTLELLESADTGCQGGKLSFWNCKIIKDDKVFVIGIAADLLLDVLKTHTVINGVVQGPLMFARCGGNVGMLSADMEAYKVAQADMQVKAAMGKGKTSKHKVGKVYSTLTQSNIYVGDFYIWYEPVYGKDPWNLSIWEKLIGFKKLTCPKIVKYFPCYVDGKNKLSDYGDKIRLWNLVDTLPKRVELAVDIEIDISKEDLINNYLNNLLESSIIDGRQYLILNSSLSEEYLGISADSTFYEFPEKLKVALKNKNLCIYDEQGNVVQ